MSLGLRNRSTIKALGNTGHCAYNASPRRARCTQRGMGRLQAALEPDLVVFGDSYSSTYHTSQCVPTDQLEAKYPSEDYRRARFADDLVWTDFLEQNLSFAKNLNWAIGGAKTICSEGDPPSVAKQITLHDFSNPHSLYIIWAGINDGLGSDAAANQISNIRKLVERGAKQLIVPGWFSLQRLPAQADPTQSIPSSIADNAEVFNQHLQEDLKALEQEADVEVLWLDTYAFFEMLIANAASYGFTNVDGAYTGDDSGDPNSFVFMDHVHWTSHTHRLFAGFALQAIEERWGHNAEGFQVRQKSTTPLDRE